MAHKTKPRSVVCKEQQVGVVSQVEGRLRNRSMRWQLFKPHHASLHAIFHKVGDGSEEPETETVN